MSELLSYSLVQGTSKLASFHGMETFPCFLEHTHFFLEKKQNANILKQIT